MDFPTTTVQLMPYVRRHAKESLVEHYMLVGTCLEALLQYINTGWWTVHPDGRVSCECGRQPVPRLCGIGKRPRMPTLSKGECKSFLRRLKRAFKLRKSAFLGEVRPLRQKRVRELAQLSQCDSDGATTP